MVSRSDMLRIARRYDTVVAHAMMRALGYQGVPRCRRRRERGGGERRAADRAKFADVRWCFENHGSPMDRR